MFSVLLGGHVLRLHGRLHALPSQLAWKALALVSSWTSLLLHSLEQRLSLRLNILHHDSFASGAGGAVCVSPFVLHFYGNVRVLKPIALSALCRVQGHWLRQNPKFFPLASDLLVPSSVPCSPLCVLIDLMQSCPVVRGRNPTCGMQFCHWKKVCWRKSYYEKAFWSFHFWVGGGDLREAF